MLVALLRWQREGSNVLSMSVPTICKYTGLDEDTVRHRLSSLSKRYFVSAGGNEFPILEVIKPAGKGRTALYALCVPRLGPEDGSNMLTRKERVEWEKIRGNNGNAVFVNVVIAGISASDFRS